MLSVMEMEMEMLVVRTMATGMETETASGRKTTH